MNDAALSMTSDRVMGPDIQLEDMKPISFAHAFVFEYSGVIFSDRPL